MALKKCKKCKMEIATAAKFCPHCGEINQSQFCRECGTEMSITETVCPKCGNIVNQAFYTQGSYPQGVPANPGKGENYEMALIGLIMSFIVPIAGLIMGIMAMKANPNKNTSAYTMGKIATIISAIEMALIVVFLVIYFFLVFVLVSSGYY